MLTLVRCVYFPVKMRRFPPIGFVKYTQSKSFYFRPEKNPLKISKLVAIAVNVEMVRRLLT